EDAPGRLRGSGRALRRAGARDARRRRDDGRRDADVAVDLLRPRRGARPRGRRRRLRPPTRAEGGRRPALEVPQGRGAARQAAVLRRARMTVRSPGVAVVTGSGRGLGQAIAARLVADGYRVVYAD